MTPLALTPGDPRGIGPEVTVKALAAHRSERPCVIVGDSTAIAEQAARIGLPVRVAESWPAEVPPDAIPVIDPGDDAEPVEVAAIRLAVHACLTGRAAGLVTGPIHKARLAARGFAWPGHTGFLGHLCGVDDPVMAFVGGSLRVALVTVHLPLRAVADALTTDRIVHVVRLADRALGQLGLGRRRLAVCGLNPHAGDDGLLGSEERDLIAPAVERCRDLDVVGPISAETAFRQAVAGQVDLVVAMYHDQGLAPLKVVDFGRSVNWTLGLPIVRTSVDHGTADDIAGQGLADPASFVAALALAERLTRR